MLHLQIEILSVLCQKSRMNCTLKNLETRLHIVNTQYKVIMLLKIFFTKLVSDFGLNGIQFAGCISHGPYLLAY